MAEFDPETQEYKFKKSQQKSIIALKRKQQNQQKTISNHTHTHTSTKLSKDNSSVELNAVECHLCVCVRATMLQSSQPSNETNQLVG